MIDAVFISDLHLNVEEPFITERFKAFITWASVHSKSLYILGDFFHAWPGDDGATPWSYDIALQLKKLSLIIPIYYLHGNRDFLLGEKFAKASGIQILSEPAFISFEKQTSQIMLAHGDRYCSHDRGHQWLRRITRNALFSKIFQKIPLSWRLKIVNGARRFSSRSNQRKEKTKMDTVPASVISHLIQYQTEILIHGHTHKVGLTKHLYKGKKYLQYVLSDWDSDPTLLCYNNNKGFWFYTFLDE